MIKMHTFQTDEETYLVIPQAREADVVHYDRAAEVFKQRSAVLQAACTVHPDEWFMIRPPESLVPYRKSRPSRFSVCLLMLAAILLYSMAIVTSAQDPRYEGRSFAQWEVDLQDLSPNVRLKAAQSLAHFGPKAIPALARSLNDPAPIVRTAVVKALGSLGPTAVPSFISALGDAEQLVAGTAEEALKGIGPVGIPGLASYEGHASFGRALKALVWVLDNAPLGSDTRKRALQDLRALPSSTAVPVLVAALRHLDTEVRTIGAQALGIMGPAARSAVPVLGPAQK